MEELYKIKERLSYLSKTVKDQGNLRLNARGRYEIEGMESTSGNGINVFNFLFCD